MSKSPGQVAAQASISLCLLVLWAAIQSTEAITIQPEVPLNGTEFASGYLLSSLLNKLNLKPQTKFSALIYDDYYIRNLLDERYAYLKLPNGSYLGIRDYFHFENVFWPTAEYLATRNIEQILYDQQQAFETTASHASLDTWLYSDRDELEQSGGPLRDPAKCRRAIASLEAELDVARERPDSLFEAGARNMDLLRWIDSWARPVSETYLGDTFWVGSYRGCRALELELNDTANGDSPNHSNSSKLITGFNYCWAKLTPRDWPGLSDPMRPRMSIKTGVCLPDSCDTLEARQMLPTILKMMQFNFSPLHKSRLTTILDIYCLPNQRQAGQKPPETGRHLSTGALWFLGLFGLWLGVILVASLWSLLVAGQAASGTQLRWWRLLTLAETYRMLAEDDAPAPNSRIDLRPLGLVKLLAALMVVLGHSFLQNYYSFHSSQVLIWKAREYKYHAMIGTWKSVEMFYVVSAILTAYSILSKFAPNNKMHLIVKPRAYFYLHLVRFLRIAPLFMLAWAFVKTTYMDLGEGPFWDYGTNKFTFMGRCKRISWWRMLIWPIIFDFRGHTGDPYQNECMAISWYIVTDLKMFIVVPFYVYLIHKRPNLRWPLLLLSLAVSTAWRLAHLHLQQLIHMKQLFTYGEMHAVHIIISKLDSSYYSAVDRFQAVAFGLTGGLYLYEFKWGRLKRWPWWMRGKSIWLLAAWWLYDSVRRPWEEFEFRTSGHIPSDDYLRAWWVLRPRMDALITTILVLRLCTDWAPAVMSHSRALYKLSKLSFGVYVFHMLPILYGVMSHERAKPDTVPLQFIQLTLFAIVTSFVISLLLYLFFEAPLSLLVDYFMLGQRKLSRLVPGAIQLKKQVTPDQQQQQLASGQQVKKSSTSHRDESDERASSSKAKLAK